MVGVVIQKIDFFSSRAEDKVFTYSDVELIDNPFYTLPFQRRDLSAHKLHVMCNKLQVAKIQHPSISSAVVTDANNGSPLQLACASCLDATMDQVSQAPRAPTAIPSMTPPQNRFLINVRKKYSL